jgi:hypothetical protein
MVCVLLRADIDVHDLYNLNGEKPMRNRRTVLRDLAGGCDERRSRAKPNAGRSVSTDSPMRR